MSEKSLPLTSSSSDSGGSIFTGGSIYETKDGKKSIGVFVSAVFIVGAMCGSGVIAVPQAVVDCSYIGAPMVVFCGLVSAYTGNMLGQCWTILRARYPEYEEERITDPYPMIAFRAGGKLAEIATRICIDATLFGGATVFLLLIAGNISELIKDIGHKEFSLCFLLLILSGILTPLTWLGTPKDFWQAGVTAAASSIIAAFFIFASLLTAAPDHRNPEHSSATFSSFFNAFGTILFAFGGASCFPTIQVDMTEPNKFPKSVVMGICTVMSVYLLVGVSGFVVLGDDMEANVLTALPSGWISYTVNILITSHLLMAYIIISNPINQEIEGAFKIDDKFGVKRLVVRTSLAGAILFVALTIPHFSIILSLIGGSTVALTNFIFPPLFYLLLARQRTPSAAYGKPPSYVQAAEVDDRQGYEGESLASHRHVQSSDGREESGWMQIQIPLHVKVILIEIILIGVVGGISSTYFSFLSLANGDSGFTVPCYVNASVGLP